LDRIKRNLKSELHSHQGASQEVITGIMVAYVQESIEFNALDEKEQHIIMNEVRSHFRVSDGFYTLKE
ncbi:hypothetical protein ADUPG1_012063, partial [Aduncisulcus paluster]